ncbi:MAG: Guanosine-3',5'-bis(Diphosphate) 3'-pyrophosphohydrolase [archaeon GW2011_AR13]|nr:MAG: Guanosine-3',5'-bis(Diphosphate) 3'-pyrophosphohydrolase [archaeon GW2011_AR13]
MDDSKEISDFLKACNDKDYLQKDINSFLIAIDFAKKNLENRKRESGEYVYKNNVNIGTILVKSNLSKEIVIAGLLYGLEKLVIAKEIKETFGEDIASIIFGQLQFNEVKKGNKNLEAGIIRKILLTSLYDVRIILVKLAVKLASLNTIQVFDAKKQKEIAKEVLDIYVPLATRLGLEYIRTRLESLAFKIVYPKQYLEISNFFKETSKEREEFVKNLVEEIKILLDNKVGIVKVKGRHKEIRSIFKKILEKGTSLKEQKDHYAIRIIVKTVDDCYKTLGILHQNYGSSNKNTGYG